MKIMTDRQWTAFKRHRVGFFSLWILIGMILLALGADLAASSMPIYMSWHGKSYFPLFHEPSTQDLGLDSTFLKVNFRELAAQKTTDDHFIWTPIAWGATESDRTLVELPSKPDSAHFMGTDDRGRDVAARLIHGLRNSLLYAIAVWFLSYFLGTVIGAIQGFFGGRTDFAIQRMIEIFNAIPALFLLIILVSILRPSLMLFILFSAVLGWIGISYYVRVEFLKLRKLEFVEAARAVGVPLPRLLGRHILPNGLTPVITFSPFALTANITGLAGLDYLGFGLAPPAASWGELLNQAQKYFEHAWWLAVFPSLALMLTLLVLNFIGEALREALDPRSGM